MSLVMQLVISNLKEITIQIQHRIKRNCIFYFVSAEFEKRLNMSQLYHLIKSDQLTIWRRCSQDRGIRQAFITPNSKRRKYSRWQYQETLSSFSVCFPVANYRVIDAVLLIDTSVLISITNTSLSYYVFLHIILILTKHSDIC